MPRALTSTFLALTLATHAAFAADPGQAGRTTKFDDAAALSAGSARDRSFDHDWLFLRADAPGAESPVFDDSSWRKLDVPHDWSIEDLPPKENSRRVGPFDPDESPSGHFTGYTIGGIGWYRKRFTWNETGKRMAVRFDGVYMNAEVWINGHRLGEHPHGYTGFGFDLTPHLKPPGQENVLAVRVRNEGRNSRWYSGSGIYRHVRLTVTEPVHVPTWGVFVTTPEVSKDKALVKVAVEVSNTTAVATPVLVRARVRDSKGHLVGTSEGGLHLTAAETRATERFLEVRAPRLWSTDSPDLYSAEVEVVIDGKTVDAVSTRFGIRKIEFDAVHGFRLNGAPLKLKGGCVHHDNGPLGAAALDRAEERKVELLKANGFNALRSSHNPPLGRTSRRLRPTRSAGDRRGVRPVERVQGAQPAGLSPLLQRLVPTRYRRDGAARPQPPLGHHVVRRQ